MSDRPLALITGGAVRLGRTVALRLASEGFDIVCHYRSSAGAAETLAEEVRALGASATLVQADLAADGAADALFDEVAERAGAPRLLLNNASRFMKDGADDFGADDLAAHMAVNLTAPAILAKRLHAATDDDGALVVNMLDAKLNSPSPDFYTYTLSKYALLGATQMMAIAYAPKVRVVGIAPSVVLISGKQSDATFERSKKMTLLGRGPDPEEIAETVLHAWRTPSMTGQTVFLDGGQRLMNLPRDVPFYVAEGHL